MSDGPDFQDVLEGGLPDGLSDEQKDAFLHAWGVLRGAAPLLSAACGGDAIFIVSALDSMVAATAFGRMTAKQAQGAASTLRLLAGKIEDDVKAGKFEDGEHDLDNMSLH